METSLVIVGSEKTYRLVAKGDVGDLSLGDIKKHIKNDSGIDPRDMEFVWQGGIIEGDKKLAKDFGIANSSELTIRRKEKPKPPEVSYFTDVLADLFSKWEDAKTDALAKRVKKAVQSLEKEMQKPGADTQSLAQANELLERVKGLKSSCSECGTAEQDVIAVAPQSILDSPMAVLRDLYPVVCLLQSDSRSGRGWDANAKSALKTISGAFLRLVKMRDRLRSVADPAERWAQCALIDSAYLNVRKSVTKLGERVTHSSVLGALGGEFHPTLTPEDIEEMEVVHLEARELLGKATENKDNDTYCMLYTELRDLMKDEARDPGPMSLSSESPAQRSAAPIASAELSAPNPCRQRLVDFYEKYNPERLSAVDEILEQYKGNEEAMFRVLEHKYVQAGVPQEMRNVEKGNRNAAEIEGNTQPGNCKLQ